MTPLKPSDAFNFQDDQSHLLNYYLKDELNLGQIRQFFQSQGWQMTNLSHPHRHFLAVLSKGSDAFQLKLASSKGMSLLLQNEANWNSQVNRLVPRERSTFFVPQNVAQGWFKNDYFYLVTDQFKGQLLVNYPFESKIDLLARYLDRVIDMMVFIGSLPLSLVKHSRASLTDYKSVFLAKTQKWFDAIPAAISRRYQLKSVLEFVKSRVVFLEPSTQHGDFTPWHIFLLENDALGLIDAEHASSQGVALYDAAYLIQRVFQVLKAPHLAKAIYHALGRRHVNVRNLKTILAARIIGGFLDEALTKKPNYVWAGKLKHWWVSDEW